MVDPFDVIGSVVVAGLVLRFLLPLGAPMSSTWWRVQCPDLGPDWTRDVLAPSPESAAITWANDNALSLFRALDAKFFADFTDPIWKGTDPIWKGLGLTVCAISHKGAEVGPVYTVRVAPGGWRIVPVG